jgi:hypothetical protein
MKTCPLCAEVNHLSPVSGLGNRLYHFCSMCKLIHCELKFHLSFDEEKKRYDLHNNNFGDEGYEQFLFRSVQQLTYHTEIKGKILDYGCGPNPVLAKIIQDKFQIHVDYYDPIYYPNPNLQNIKYDIIFCTEVIEHFRTPSAEWKKMLAITKQNAYLAIMTECYDNLEQFETWYYTGDPTHISFYNDETMNWIAAHFNLTRLHSEDKRVFLFQK